MSNGVTSEQIRTWREQGLSATVHVACSNCHAPGVFTSAAQIKPAFPACYVEPGDERDGQPVGEICPHCQTGRAPTLIKRLGEIWRRKFT
jgi:hypothetical protein